MAENNDGFTINVNSPGNFIAKEITFTGPVNIGGGNPDLGHYTDEQIAEKGLQALKDWMLEIGLPLTISELGATADMIPGITETTVIYPAGYLDLTKEDITEILQESM